MIDIRLRVADADFSDLPYRQVTISVWTDARTETCQVVKTVHNDSLVFLINVLATGGLDYLIDGMARALKKEMFGK